MIPRIQHQTHTFRDRYPDALRRLARLMRGHPQPHVLVFGSSTGEECLDVADALPNAHVHGVEIDDATRERAITRSPHPRVTYPPPADADRYREAGLQFDAVLCHSVFCHHPEASQLPVNTLWTFADFERALAEIDQLLEAGGWLSLINAEFAFGDTALCATKYRTHPARFRQGVRQFDRYGTATARQGTDVPTLFRKVRP